MPLRDDLLNPIPGPNPSGESLRYAPVYDEIKEARREEEAVTEGDWRREGKKADWPVVIRLANEALATKSKDLQLAAWLIEALIHREGFAALKPGFELLRGLVEQFWDGLHPELEDGDAEMRAAPLEWIGSCLDMPIKQVLLTRSGLDWFQYKQSRSVPYEEECVENEARRAAREAAVAEGKLTPEEFDAALALTPKAFYQEAFERLEGALESLQSLSQVCDERFGDVAPGFAPLRATLEDVRQTVRMLLVKKREAEEAGASKAAVEEAPAEEIGEEAAPWPAEAGAPVRRAARAPAAEPSDRDDAFERLIAVARYLRREDAYSPVSYLLLRALRWGELRAAGSSPDYSLLEAPPTEVRQELKRLASDGQWQEALEAAENAMGLPCGRAWLDLQRYAVRACEELGYEAIAVAVRAELKALLADYPELPQWSLADDTPAANAETQAWLKELAPAKPQEEAYPVVEWEPAPPPAEGETQVIDAYELALDAVRSGRPREAIEILARESAQERSGRGRFRRRIQLAEICMAGGHEQVAYAILQELVDEIERRKLEEWESPDVVAHPLALLFRCMAKLDRDNEARQKIYARICRLDPMQALACSK